jgi:hypothetical protein
MADLLRRAEANGLPLTKLVLPSESAVDDSLIAEAKAGGRTFAVWPAAEGRDSTPESSTGLTLEEGRQMVRSAAEARRVVEARMGEIGLDHFEVRTFRSLTRHLALSAASLLFLAEQGERTRRGRESFPIRSHG